MFLMTPRRDYSQDYILKILNHIWLSNGLSLDFTILPPTHSLHTKPDIYIIKKICAALARVPPKTEYE
jgi:hypothetical protein